MEEDHSNDEQQGNHADTGVNVASDLADDADEGGAHKRGAFAADVHEAKIFARLLWRNNASKIRARECLNAALEHADQHGQHPELPLMR